MGHRMIRVVAVCLAVAVLAGCQTIRVREQDTMEGAPPWAIRNAMLEGDPGMTYFVGVSGEQVPSESEAIDQAYEQAIRRAADAIGASVLSTSCDVQFASTTTGGKWPFVPGTHLGKGFLFLPGLEGSEYGRYSKQGTTTNEDSRILRDQIIGMAQIVDTWTVRENFRTVVAVNSMKYGELWKAKVLLAVPTRELEQRAEKEYEIRMREVDLMMESAPKPTFSFMNNSAYTGIESWRGSHFVSYERGPRPQIIERGHHH